MNAGVAPTKNGKDCKLYALLVHILQINVLHLSGVTCDTKCDQVRCYDNIVTQWAGVDFPSLDMEQQWSELLFSAADDNYSIQSLYQTGQLIKITFCGHTQHQTEF